MDEELIRANIRMLMRLPGVGERSAKRLLLHMMQKQHDVMLPLANSLKMLSDQIVACSVCCALGVQNPCRVCLDSKRDQEKICVVESTSSLWAVQASHAYNGMYHVLGGLLSVQKGVGEININIDALVKRCKDSAVKEVIIALSPTVESQPTVYYIYDILQDCNISITSLAKGIPIGGEIDYFDDSTIARAFDGRTNL